VHLPFFFPIFPLNFSGGVDFGEAVSLFFPIAIQPPPPSADAFPDPPPPPKLFLGDRLWLFLRARSAPISLFPHTPPAPTIFFISLSLSPLTFPHPSPQAKKEDPWFWPLSGDALSCPLHIPRLPVLWFFSPTTFFPPTGLGNISCGRLPPPLRNPSVASSNISLSLPFFRANPGKRQAVSSAVSLVLPSLRLLPQFPWPVFSPKESPNFLLGDRRSPLLVRVDCAPLSLLGLPRETR